MGEKVGELAALTSNSSMLGSTEVAVTVSVLVSATINVTGNRTVSNNNNHPIIDHFLLTSLPLVIFSFCQ